VLAVSGEEHAELVAGVQVGDELADPAAVAGAGASGERLALQPAVVVGEDLVGGHPRILSETAGRPTRARCGRVVRRPGGVGFREGCLSEPPASTPAPSSRAATSQRVRTASAARPLRQRAPRRRRRLLSLRRRSVAWPTHLLSTWSLTGPVVREGWRSPSERSRRIGAAGSRIETCSPPRRRGWIAS
jgi:hypothetical protein